MFRWSLSWVWKLILRNCRGVYLDYMSIHISIKHRMREENSIWWMIFHIVFPNMMDDVCDCFWFGKCLDWWLTDVRTSQDPSFSWSILDWSTRTHLCLALDPAVLSQSGWLVKSHNTFILLYPPLPLWLLHNTICWLWWARVRSQQKNLTPCPLARVIWALEDQIIGKIGI